MRSTTSTRTTGAVSDIATSARGIRFAHPREHRCTNRRGGSMGELDGKIAVITGAGSGMARASTRVFVREGAKVLAADISGRENDTAAELGDSGGAVPLRRDPGVRGRSNVRGSVARVRSRRRRAQRRRHRRRPAGRQGHDGRVRPDHGRRSQGRAARNEARHQCDAPDGRRRDRELVLDRGHERVGNADQRVLGREGRRHLVHQVRRGRVRRPGASAPTRSAPASS